MTTTTVQGAAVLLAEAIDAPMMARVHLGHRDVLTLAGGTPGLQILSDRCTIWLTEDGAMDDVILKPGERYTVSRQRRVVLQGMR
jgi:hypothetical protein